MELIGILIQQLEACDDVDNCMQWSKGWLCHGTTHMFFLLSFKGDAERYMYKGLKEEISPYVL